MVHILLVLAIFGSMRQPNSNEDVPWQWSDDSVSIMHWFQRGSTDYDVSLTKPKSKHSFVLNVAISDGDDTLCEFESHFEGAFAFSQSGAVVVYSQHSPIATGCTLVAFDLAGKRELWTKHLKGIGPVSHSKWRNRINLIMEKDRVIVFGDEGKKYVEVLALKTGETISHRVLNIVQFDGEPFEYQPLVKAASITRPFPVPLLSGNDPGVEKDGKPWSGNFLLQSHKTELVIEKYRNGKRHGASIGFYNPRIKHWDGVYQNGEKHGSIKIWSSDGQLHSTTIYENGKLISETPAK